MFPYLPNLFNNFFPYLAACKTRRRQAQYTAREARRRQLRCCQPRLEFLEDRVVPALDTFIAASGEWTDPANWNLGYVPGSSDVAVIPVGATCTLNSGPTGETVAGLTVKGSTLTIASGKLSVTSATSNFGGTFYIKPGAELDVLSSADFNGGGTINGRIDANTSDINFNPSSFMTLGAGTNLTGSGTFNINGPVTVTGGISQNAVMVLNDNGSSTAGSLTGSGSMDDSGEFDWNGGSLGLAGGEKFEANADLKLQGADAKTLTTGILTNQCNASSIGGTGALTISSGAEFDNLGNPTCDMTIPTITTTGSGSFINDADGFLNVQSTTTISGNFSNLGTLNVPGSLTLTNPGGDTVNLDSHVQVDGTLTLLGNISSPNGFIEDSGSGTLKVGDGSTASTLTVAGGYSAILSGLLEVTSTGTFNGGGEIQNNDKLQLDIGSTTDIGSYLGGNSGTLDLQAGSPTSYSSLTVAGSAALSGTLELDFLNGYQPSSGTAFVLLKASSIGAHFDSTPPDMTTTYSSTQVTVTQN